MIQLKVFKTSLKVWLLQKKEKRKVGKKGERKGRRRKRERERQVIHAIQERITSLALSLVPSSNFL